MPFIVIAPFVNRLFSATLLITSVGLRASATDVTNPTFTVIGCETFVIPLAANALAVYV